MLFVVIVGISTEMTFAAVEFCLLGLATASIYFDKRIQAIYSIGLLGTIIYIIAVMKAIPMEEAVPAIISVVFASLYHILLQSVDMII